MTKGRSQTEATKEKLRLVAKPPKWWLTGKREEIAKKISESKIGKSVPHKAGFKQSEETKQKKREYMKANPVYYWKGKKLSTETRIKMSNSHQTRLKDLIRKEPENQRIRKSFEYKLWREAVFERDKYTCIWCGIKNGNGKTIILHADHIKPFALFPELRFAIDNGRTLCKECHKTTTTYGRQKVNIRKELL